MKAKLSKILVGIRVSEEDIAKVVLPLEIPIPPIGSHFIYRGITVRVIDIIYSISQINELEIYITTQNDSL